MTMHVVYGPQADATAEWAFYPSSKTRKEYSNAEMDEIGMDAQEGEIISLDANSQKILDGDLVIELSEGLVKLLDYESSWRPCESFDDVIVWDIDRILREWSSND